MDPIHPPMAELGDYTQGAPAAPRFSVEIPAHYQVRGEDLMATGKIQNISKSGALLDDQSYEVPVGSRVRLSFSLYSNSRPLRFSAEVVRIATSGFAVRFTDMDPRNRKLLEAALPMLDAIKRGKPQARL